MAPRTARRHRHGAALVLFALAACLIAVPEAGTTGHDRTPRRRLPGSPISSPQPTLTLAVDGGSLVPGASGDVVVRSLNALPISRGQVTIQVDPPIFIDNPVLGFASALQAGSVVMRTTAPGSYVVDLDGTASPFNSQAGILVIISGTVRQDLPIGSTVSVAMEASAVTATGERVQVLARGASLPVVADDPSLVLSVDSGADLIPGTTVDMVIRSYNPKPISQGQIDLTYDRTAFGPVQSARVHGSEPDVSFTADLNTPGRVLLSFTSPSSSINRLDGPMITLRMTLDAGLQPGAQTWMTIDLPNTILLDQGQRAVVLTTRGGTFKIGD